MIYQKPLVTGLFNAYMKADRAEVHLKELETQIRNFIEANPHVITYEDDVKQFLHIIRIELKPCDEIIPALVGEIVYNLRHALDNLAWQLAIKNVSNPSSHTSFPIRGVRPAKGFGDATKDILPQAVTIIESLQPYHRGAAFKEDLLWILNELCIIDKHSTPAVNGSSFKIRTDNAEQLHRRDSHYGTEMVFSLADKFVVKLDPGPPEIILGRPIDSSGPPFEAPLTVLRDIHKFIRNEVLPRFAGFFK